MQDRSRFEHVDLSEPGLQQVKLPFGLILSYTFVTRLPAFIVPLSTLSVTVVPLFWGIVV